GVASKISVGGATIQSNALYYFEVLIAPTTVTTISPDNPVSGGWVDSTIMMTNTAHGHVVGSNDNYDPAGGGAQVPSGFPTAASADFAVVGWSANLGPTLADALAWWSDGSVLTGNPGVDPGLVPGIPFFGISGVALDIPGAPAGGPYNNIWGLASEGAIQGMELSDYLIPEPATSALWGLGGAALVIFRGRRRFRGVEVLSTRNGSGGRA